MLGDVRPALVGEARALGGLIGSAFAEDPVSRWALGRPETITAVFTALAEAVYLPRGICHVADGAGGTMWLAPGGSKEPAIGAQLGVVWQIIAGSGLTHVGRGLKLQAAMQKAAPKEPHFYLFTVGVVPAARGKGLARRLLAPVLAEADSRGLPCWLENSNPANTGLYLSLGFEPTDRLQPPDGCPPIVGMRRAPRA